MKPLRTDDREVNVRGMKWIVWRKKGCRKISHAQRVGFLAIALAIALLTRLPFRAELALATRKRRFGQRGIEALRSGIMILSSHSADFAIFTLRPPKTQ